MSNLSSSKGISQTTDYEILAWLKESDGNLMFPSLTEQCPKTWNWGPCPGSGQLRTAEDKCPICNHLSWKLTKNGKTRRHSGQLPNHTSDCRCLGTGRVPVEHDRLERLLEIMQKLYLAGDMYRSIFFNEMGLLVETENLSWTDAATAALMQYVKELQT